MSRAAAHKPAIREDHDGVSEVDPELLAVLRLIQGGVRGRRSPRGYRRHARRRAQPGAGLAIRRRTGDG